MKLSGIVVPGIIILVSLIACGPTTLDGAQTNAQGTLVAAQARATVIGGQITVAARQTQSVAETQATLVALESQRVLAEQQLKAAQDQAKQAAQERKAAAQWTSQAVARNVQGTATFLQATIEAIPPAQTIAAGTAQAVDSQARATATVNTSQIIAAQEVISQTAMAEVARQEWSVRTQMFWTCANGFMFYILPTTVISLLVYGFMRAVKAYELNKRVVVNADGEVVGVITLPTVRGQDPIVRIVGPQQSPTELSSPEPRDELAPPSFDALPENPGVMDLNSIPGPLMLPIGVTLRHPEGFWVSLVDGDSFLVAGARRKGKTNLLKTWIQSLIVSRAARLVMFDGKSGVEFGQYRSLPRCLVVETDTLLPTLEQVHNEMGKRIEVFRERGVASVAQFNQRSGGRESMDRLILIVDELAFALREEGVEEMLVDLIARGGAFGIHPILATQRPSVDVITPQIKANLSTRIALPVASSADSRVILDRGGAEKLPKVPGRLMMLWDAQVIEAQAWLAPEELPQWITRSRRQISKPAPTLTDVELAMAQAAIENNGRFAIDRVHGLLRAKGITIARQIVGKTAQEWEKRGWLTEEQRKDNGQSDSRHVTEELRRLVGLQSTLALPNVSSAQVPPLAA